ncbi:MAG TPA: hypothetical protein VHB69_13320 [Mycobacteriales bacterium]|nr:hypothetical protein [Mycobacteriales bacterium]
MPDEDDRPRDASGSADRPAGADADATWSDIVVPDDISELSRDVAAYRREVRHAARARRVRRILARRGAVPALVLTGATLLAGIVAVLLTMMAPRTLGHPPAATALAAPTKPPGTLHGLVPSAALRTQDGTLVDTRSAVLRPEVYALVPVSCGCGELLNALSGQAGSEQLRLGIVIPAAKDDTTTSLLTDLHRGRPSVFYDSHATFATAVASSGVTVVVVAADGTIYDVEKNITDPATTNLDAVLQSMLLRQRS